MYVMSKLENYTPIFNVWFMYKIYRHCQSVLKWNGFFSSNCHSAISSGQSIFQSYCADASLGFAKIQFHNCVHSKQYMCSFS